MSATDEAIVTTPIEDDELPAPPQADPASGGEEVHVDGAYDPGVLKTADKLGEPIPAGTYSFRLESRSTGVQKAESMTGDRAKFQVLGDQPWYMTRWVCTQEPQAGRSFFHLVPWCNQQTFKAAKAGDPLAKELVKTRLMSARTILEGLEWRGSSNIEDFFKVKPEGKLTLGIREKKAKDQRADSPTFGTYIPTGEMENTLLKVFPLYAR